MKGVNGIIRSMKYRLAFFLPNLGAGGAQRVLITLANEYASKGHEVEIILQEKLITYADEIYKPIKLSFLGTTRRYPSAIRLAYHLRKHSPDAVLASIYSANFIAILAKILSRTPFPITIREANTPTQVLSAARVSTRENFMVRLYYRYLYPRANSVVAVSKGVAQDLSNLTKIPSNKLHVIYNPVINDDLLRKAEEPLEHPWFAVGQPPVVLAVAGLRYQKGLDILLHAFAVAREMRKCRLVILGEGRLYQQLKDLSQSLGVAEDVDLPGFDVNPFRYMRRASVFVLSSRYEGLPNVLIQAMACGCPVVSTDCPSGPSEILDGGKYGILVPVGDVEALARGIVQALDGDARFASAQWLSQFRVEQVAQRYLDVLLERV